MPVAGPLTTGVAISASGSRLAFSQQIRQDGIWSVPIDLSGAPRGEPKALVQDFSVRNMEPDFSQDGSMIAYASLRQGEKAAVLVANADGSGAQSISPTGVNCAFPTWLGTERCTYRCAPDGNIWMAPLRGPPRRLSFKLDTEAWPRIARLMRMILVDYARAHHAAKRGGAGSPVTLDDCMAVSPSRPPDVLEIDEALDRLAAVDERKAKVIELRDFGGMDREEVAAALGLTVPTVKRDLRLGEAWLRRFLGAERRRRV